MTRVRYAPGPLRVAVAPQGLAVVGRDTRPDVVEALWETLVSEGGPAEILDLLAAGRSLSALPPFVIALQEPSGWRLLVRGQLATVTVHSSSGTQVIEGSQASTWVERSIPDATTLTIGEDAAAAALPARDAVVAAEVVVVRADEDAADGGRADAAAPAAPAEPVQPHSVEEVRDIQPEAPTPPVEPVQPHSVEEVIDGVPAASSLPDEVEATLIRQPGQAASAGFSAPVESEDRTLSLEEARALRAQGKLPAVGSLPLASPRPSSPPAGRVRLSTGQVVALDRTVVIGRRPRSTRAASTDLPHLITVDSPQHDISRNHLELRTEGDSILATDLNTTNGTTLLRPATEPVRLHPGEQTIVVPGDVLDLGDGVTVTVEGAE